MRPYGILYVIMQFFDTHFLDKTLKSFMPNLKLDVRLYADLFPLDNTYYELIALIYLVAASLCRYTLYLL